MKKTLIGLALALCLSLGAGSAPLARAQAPGQGTRPADDPFARFVFPPELVMAHQQKLNLSDRARAAIQDAIKEAQGKFVDAQWRLSGEGEKLQKLLQATTVDEAKVLEQIDRILNVEREIKRAQIGLLVRIKNQLTEQQQAELAKLRAQGPRDWRSPP
ncbi:MAG TPA: periplasmic heavy metal sensor [Gemmatimonadaceae bacterium]|nr:periplasmic heavy metal sensor [Gemmatimonadaceae bacterium]